MMGLSPETVGYLGCVLGVIGFGSQGVFVKSKPIREAGVHPFLVVLLFSLCVALVGLLIGLAAAASGNQFWKQPGWAKTAWVALAYAPGNTLLLWSCRRIGVGLAVGIVASCTSVTAFVLGVVLLNDSLDPTTKIPGLLLIVLGSFIMGLTRVPAFEDWVDPIPPHLLIEVLGEERLLADKAQEEERLRTRQRMQDEEGSVGLAAQIAVLVAEEQGADVMEAGPRDVGKKSPFGKNRTMSAPGATESLLRGDVLNEEDDNDDGLSLASSSSSSSVLTTQAGGGHDGESVPRGGRRGGGGGGGGGGYDWSRKTDPGPGLLSAASSASLSPTFPCPFSEEEEGEKQEANEEWAGAGAGHQEGPSRPDRTQPRTAPFHSGERGGGGMSGVGSVLHEDSLGGTLLVSGTQAVKFARLQRRVARAKRKLKEQKGKGKRRRRQQEQEQQRVQCQQGDEETGTKANALNRSSLSSSLSAPLLLLPPHALPEEEETKQVEGDEGGQRGLQAEEHREEEQDSELSTPSLEPYSEASLLAVLLEGYEEASADPSVDLPGMGLAAAGGFFLGLQGALFGELVNPHRLAGDLSVFMLAQFPATLLLLLPSIADDPKAILTLSPPLKHRADETSNGPAEVSSDSLLCPPLPLSSSSVFAAVKVSICFALAGALCFSAAVFGQVLGIDALPENVAMPLTQLNIVVAGSWGVVYFKEVENGRLVAVFALAVVVELGGAALLALVA